jgi:hypothetical protein
MNGWPRLWWPPRKRKPFCADLEQHQRRVESAVQPVTVHVRWSPSDGGGQFTRWLRSEVSRHNGWLGLGDRR